MYSFQTVLYLLAEISADAREYEGIGPVEDVLPEAVPGILEKLDLIAL